MSWSRLTPLATDRAHCHAVHEALIKRNASPRYQAIQEASHAAYERVQATINDLGLSEGVAWNAEYQAHGYGDHIENQCGGCRFYITWEGDLGMDWGTCTRLDGEFFGRPMFEHDGCAQFEADCHEEGVE